MKENLYNQKQNYDQIKFPKANLKEKVVEIKEEIKVKKQE